MAEGDFPKTNGEVLYASEVNSVMGLLGQIIQIDISRTNAVSKTYMQDKGWAICDGTTPAAQGIADATITTTPDLREKFLRHSADETTGGTGGTNSLTLTANNLPEHTHPITVQADNAFGSTPRISFITNGNVTTTFNTLVNSTTATAINNQPAYYDICYFIKVK